MVRMLRRIEPVETDLSAPARRLRIRRRRPSFSVAAVVGLLALACGDGTTDPVPPPTPPPTPPNRAPAQTGSIPAQTVHVGETVTVNVSSYFTDPDGDALTYTAASSEPGVATVTVAGSTLTVTAATQGTATVTVTARDPDGLSAQQNFTVTVPNRAPEALVTASPDTITTEQFFTSSPPVAEWFSDPDEDPLTFAVGSSDEGVAVAELVDGELVVRAVAPGTATITVSAADPGGLSAEVSFDVTVVNRAPEALETIPAREMTAGDTVTVDVSAYFTDPDGEELIYAAESNNTAALTVDMDGSTLALTAVAAGEATVTVTATDPSGLSASSSFGVTVFEAGFQIELVFATPFTQAQEAAFHRAARRWEAILAPTNLPPIPLNRDLNCGDDPRFERHVGTIDDLIIVVAVGEIDGPGEILAQAGPCMVRTSNSLPVYGRMEFDVVDLEHSERIGGLEDLILHEMGHVLGIGTIWEELGLVRDPASEAEAPDTHFTGRRTIAAFDEAGGTGYRGAKVPVENTGGPGTRNSHWRESILVTELMTGYGHGGTPEPLSAITIQSLADIGYAVDVSLADPYRIPDSDAARALEAAPRIPYGDDIWRGPVVVVDPDGRIVRRIPR